MKNQSETKKPRILLVGDADKAFVNPKSADTADILFCAGVNDAVDAASQRDFALIAVVITGSSVNLDASLKSLRKARPNSKIILLAHMYQEPVAISFIQPDRDGKQPADDYLICPIVTHDFDKWLDASVKTSGVTTEKISLIDEIAITEKIRQLEKLATEDDVTGLKNRRYIWEFGSQIIARAAENDRQVTLLVFDIDDFKHYNDTYGHPTGDDILRQAAVLIKSCCRKHDVVGRIGGDEFAVIFWDDPRRREGTERRSSSEHPTEAVFISERLRSQLQNAQFGVLGPTGKGVLTISGGLATFPRDGATIEELFRKADQALFDAKQSGKNCIYLVGQPNNRK
ncbi:MAG: GGDEF domain-containing protein [Phycisphaerae bacterium]|jgi:diguanylate cyclase (GGDEF)-like protein